MISDAAATMKCIIFGFSLKTSFKVHMTILRCQCNLYIVKTLMKTSYNIKIICYYKTIGRHLCSHMLYASLPINAGH